MQTTTRLALYLGCLFLLAACGSKGPLYLPPPTAAALPPAHNALADHNTRPEPA